jgi:hypothetical protein
MKKVTTLFFASVLMLGLVFIGESLSSKNPYAAEAQTVSVVKRKTTNFGRRTYRGGKWVTVRVYRGGKWVTKKVWRASKWTARKTKRGAVTGYRKAKSGTMKAVDKTKDALD